MTKGEREKAIDLLDNLLGMVEDNQDNDYDKALKMGIESLRKEPCEDVVSRKAVLNQIFYSTDNSGDVVLGSELKNRIKALPSVTPTQKWIPVSSGNLPKDGQRVYVTQTFEGGTVAYCTRFPFEETKKKYIIAWQPLPEPYVPDTNVGKTAEMESEE